MNEIYRGYEILSRLDVNTNGKVKNIFKKIFNIPILDFIRSAIWIFTVAKASGNGQIIFKKNDFDNKIIGWEINVANCQLVASKISYNETFLWDDWYNQGFLKAEKMYQKYYPNPLFKVPLINRDFKENNVDFLLPYPRMFMRSLMNFIFSHLYNYNATMNDKINFSSEVGCLMESHIQFVLKSIFGNENVHKIESEEKEKRADFYIEHELANIIIEEKNALGDYESSALLSPQGIAKIWGRLYEACSQCSYSVKKFRNTQKNIIVIILVADHIVIDPMSFHYFADISGIFSELEIDFLRFFSWNKLEYELSKKSTHEFIFDLLNKKQNNTNIDERNFSSIPSHNYEHFEDVKLEVLGTR